jgi:hypothetical protein
MLSLLYLAADIPRVDLADETELSADDERRQDPHPMFGDQGTAEGSPRMHLRYLNVTILVVRLAENGPNAVAVGAVPFGHEQHF